MVVPDVLNTGSTVAIFVVIILGFILAGQGAVGVQMSYFPELFGTRYCYVGATLAASSPRCSAAALRR